MESAWIQTHVSSFRSVRCFEELKCLLLYNRWSMSKSLNYSWHAEAFKQLAKALLCSSLPFFVLTVILKGYFSILFEYYATFFQVNLKPILDANKSFFCHCFLILKPLSKKWKYYFRLSLKKSWTFPEFSPPFICSLEMKLARSKNFFLSSAVSTFFFYC